MRIRIASINATAILALWFNSRGHRTHWQE